MTINITDSELKALVKANISATLGVPESTLKVSFTKRSTQIDTSVEIIKAGQPHSLADHVPGTDAQEEEVAQDESTETDNISAILK